MRNRIIRNALVVGIIGLFVGISMIPGIIGQSGKQNDATVRNEQILMHLDECNDLVGKVHATGESASAFDMLNKMVESSPLSENLFLNPPPSYDLRNVNGKNYTTSVKTQQGGTCWCHAVMASMESNLLITGNWAAAGESGEPNLAEYHLDWWNGFNLFYNSDDPTSGGLPVHFGGDFLMASAYLSRGTGAVRDIDGQSYYTPPDEYKPTYHIYYPQNIEWFTAGSNLENMNGIKQMIMLKGAIATYHSASDAYKQDYPEGYRAFYQPPNTPNANTHNVVIIGWDDSKITPADSPGAWLCKDSRGTIPPQVGYYWISYFDKLCCQDPKQGAVSFQDVEPLIYNHIYFHDYHGWRCLMPYVVEAFNAYTAKHEERLEAVSFFTAENNVAYHVKIYGRFQNGNLLDELSNTSGVILFKGFHTIRLDHGVNFTTGDEFYIYLQLSTGGHPIDRTSYVSPAFGDKGRSIVNSSAQPGESYYRAGTTWLDLYYYNFSDQTWNYTANFCIKGLTKFTGIKAKLRCVPGYVEWKNDTPVPPGSIVIGEFYITNAGDNDTFLNWAIVDWPDWGTWSFTPSSGWNVFQGQWIKITVTVTAPDIQNKRFNGTILVINTKDPNDYEEVSVVPHTPISLKSMNSQFVLKNMFYRKLIQRINF